MSQNTTIGDFIRGSEEPPVEGMNVIALFKKFEQQLTVFHDRYNGVVYDLTIPEDEKAARADRLEIGKVISRLDTAHKAAKAPLKEQVDLIDGERKRIKDLLIIVQDKIKSQIATHDNKILAHAAALENRVVEIEELYSGIDQSLYFSLCPNDIIPRLEKARAVIIDSSFEKREADAALAKIKSIEGLESLLAKLEKEKAQADELARLKAEEDERNLLAREDEIRKEAEAKTMADAQAKIDKAEQQREDAVKAKKQAIINADQQREIAAAAELQAKADAVRREKQAKQAAAQKARLAVETERNRVAKKKAGEQKALELRQADKTHKAKIIAEIERDFISVGLVAEAGIAARAIADGLIRHVVIKL